MNGLACNLSWYYLWVSSTSNFWFAYFSTINNNIRKEGRRRKKERKKMGGRKQGKLTYQTYRDSNSILNKTFKSGVLGMFGTK